MPAVGGSSPRLSSSALPRRMRRADARPVTRFRTALLAVTLVLTVAAYAFLLLITGFVACGISGCSGEGFGPSYAPVQAQIALGVCGLVLVPCALLVLRRSSRRRRVVAAVATGLAGSVLAMALLGLGPDGCPFGHPRTTAGPEDFSPGEPTCARDRLPLVRSASLSPAAQL